MHSYRPRNVKIILKLVGDDPSKQYRKGHDVSVSFDDTDERHF